MFEYSVSTEYTLSSLPLAAATLAMYVLTMLM